MEKTKNSQFIWALPFIIAFVVVMIMYFVLPEAFIALQNFLSSIPDISINMGNFTINMDFDSINLGYLDLEKEIPELGISIWTLILSVFFITSVVISLYSQSFNTIFSYISLLFPVIFINSILSSYNDAISQGSTTWEAALYTIPIAFLAFFMTLIGPHQNVSRNLYKNIAAKNDNSREILPWERVQQLEEDEEMWKMHLEKDAIIKHVAEDGSEGKPFSESEKKILRSIARRQLKIIRKEKNRIQRDVKAGKYITKKKQKIKNVTQKVFINSLKDTALYAATIALFLWIFLGIGWPAVAMIVCGGLLYGNALDSMEISLYS